MEHKKEWGALLSSILLLIPVLLVNDNMLSDVGNFALEKVVFTVS